MCKHRFRPGSTLRYAVYDEANVACRFGEEQGTGIKKPDMAVRRSTKQRAIRFGEEQGTGIKKPDMAVRQST
jgi:hypothetical protein